MQGCIPAAYVREEARVVKQQASIDPGQTFSCGVSVKGARQEYLQFSKPAPPNHACDLYVCYGTYNRTDMRNSF